jgi:hypothetical protein
MNHLFENATRAKRFQIAIDVLNPDFDQEQEILIDLLADAMHWCDANCEDFHYCLAMACRHYINELNDEQQDERRMHP